MLTAILDVEAGASYRSENVVAEIRGGEKPQEIVVVGAHLDSWDLGTGALDNGCNVALVIDLARQMQALALKPRRTVRFALWNGEEQMMNGSWGYAKGHAAERSTRSTRSTFGSSG
jgi:Zn-dependent M28 family amino/carboxypeptidase